MGVKNAAQAIIRFITNRTLKRDLDDHINGVEIQLHRALLSVTKPGETGNAAIDESIRLVGLANDMIKLRNSLIEMKSFSSKRIE